MSTSFYQFIIKQDDSFKFFFHILTESGSAFQIGVRYLTFFNNLFPLFVCTLCNGFRSIDGGICLFRNTIVDGFISIHRLFCIFFFSSPVFITFSFIFF